MRWVRISANVTAKASDYSLSNWRALTCYLDDGNVLIDNNAAENAVRPIVAWGWLHVLRRRGQQGRMPWSRFARIVERNLPRVRVLHPYPHQRSTS